MQQSKDKENPNIRRQSKVRSFEDKMWQLDVTIVKADNLAKNTAVQNVFCEVELRTQREKSTGFPITQPEFNFNVHFDLGNVEVRSGENLPMNQLVFRVRNCKDGSNVGIFSMNFGPFLEHHNFSVHQWYPLSGNSGNIEIQLKFTSAELPSNIDLEEQPKDVFPLGFVGPLDRGDAERRISKEEVGVYLLRWSDRQDSYVLTYMNKDYKPAHIASIKVTKSGVEVVTETGLTKFKNLHAFIDNMKKMKVITRAVVENNYDFSSI